MLFYTLREKSMMSKRIIILFVGIILFVAALLAGMGCEPVTEEIDYDELRTILDDALAMQQTTIIDIRSGEAWQQGHIKHAINIAYDSCIDIDGNLIADGAALTSIMTDKQRSLIVYGSAAENVVLFVEKAGELGYTDVRFYRGGIQDWKNQGDYLIVSYAGFKAWHDASCPFDDGENCLVDVNSKKIYNDNGHIPGAVNIVSNYFVTKFGVEASDLQLSDIVKNYDAKIVFYCYFDS